MDISEQEQKIRDFINRPRKQSSLLADSAGWNRLCSSLDVIGDAELAISSYPSMCGISGDGQSYIIIYGILQILLAQQDAAKHICAVLGIKCKLPKELKKIREIRTSAVGHPTSQKEKGIAKSNFIQRFSICPLGFELMTVYSEGHDYQARHINIPKLIEIQNEYLGEILKKVLHELESEEMKHHEAHGERKVQDVFPQTLSYYFQKIFEANRGGAAFGLGLPHLKFVEECLDAFKNDLKARDEWGIYDSIDYHVELISYPLDELKQYFSMPKESKLNQKDVYIFISFVSDQIESLKKITSEIDEEYESKPQG